MEDLQQNPLCDIIVTFFFINIVEYVVHGRLHIYHLCGIFYFPWHRHQIEGTR